MDQQKDHPWTEDGPAGEGAHYFLAHGSHENPRNSVYCPGRVSARRRIRQYRAGHRGWACCMRAVSFETPSSAQVAPHRSASEPENPTPDPVKQLGEWGTGGSRVAVRVHVR